MTVYLNGKFIAQATTGVQRVAACLLQALDGLPAASTRGWVLLHPGGTTPPALRHIRSRPLGPAGLPLHLWEQLALPWAARDGWLLNLAGSAPALARRQLCQVHDAAVFDNSVTYTRQFGWWYRCIFLWLARRKVQFLTVSEFSRQRLMHHLPLSADHIQVLGNGADHLDHIAPAPQVLDRLALHGVPYLLAVASHSPGKNLPRLLQAFADLPATLGCKLVLVGDGNGRVFRDSQDLPNLPNVLRTGRISDAELKALYQHATALVMPSLYEGYGLPAVEAMRLGCPVVAADAAALPEVCGGAALLVDPLSTAAITAALQQVLNEAPLRQRLREAGHRRSAPLTWQRASRRLVAWVDEMGRP